VGFYRDREFPLPLAAVATGFALLAADLASAPGLGHACAPFLIGG
jgi:hypothetical protein